MWMTFVIMSYYKEIKSNFKITFRSPWNIVQYILNSVKVIGIFNFTPVHCKLITYKWTVCETHSNNVLSSSFWIFSAIRSGDYYMFDELDDDVLEEKDEMSSDEEVGKHDGDRRVTLSQVSTFIMCVLVENRMSVCGTRVVWINLHQWFPSLITSWTFYYRSQNIWLFISS